LDLYREELEKKGDYSHSNYMCISEPENAEFWNVCLGKVGSTEEHQFVIKENVVLLEKARAIKSELIKRIERTWLT
jgi:hypothetical protein